MICLKSSRGGFGSTIIGIFRLCRFVAQCGRFSAPCVWPAYLAMPAVTCPVDHALTDLAEVANLVACQCAAGLSRDDVLDALFRSWSSRLQLLGTCSDAHKSSLTAAITAGPWTNEQRKSLARVLIYHPDASPLTKRRPNQTCCHFGNFIPAALWVKLRGTTNVSRVASKHARDIGPCIGA